jgi:cytoskeletal protein RodZ
MSTFGEQLRQARESQGISLQQAAMETHIMQQSLIALEEGIVENLSNEVVVKGFLRNYAFYLGLPADEIIELYRRERKNPTNAIRVVPATSLVPERSYILPNFLGVFFVTIALIGLAYVVLNITGYLQSSHYAGYHEPEASTSIPTPTPLNVAPAAPRSADSANPPTSAITGTDQTPPGPLTPSVLPPDPQPTGYALSPATPRPAAGGVAPMPAATKTATPAAPIVVNLQITPDGADSWLRVTVDGGIAFEGIMRSGQSEVYHVQRNIHIRAGNPPVVNVGVNGSQPEPLGTTPGQPVNWSWPPNAGGN